jgi:hypothetical protein
MTKTIGTKNYSDHRDLQSTPTTTTEGGGGPRKSYGVSDQLSEPGNDELLSGLPHKSDGTPRHNSQASSPLATPSKTGPTKPVNPKK